MQWEAKIISIDGNRKMASIRYSSGKEVVVNYCTMTLISIWEGRKLRSSNTASLTLASKRSPATRRSATHFPDRSSTTTKQSKISARTHFYDCDGENLATGKKAQKSTKKKEVTFLSKRGAGKENRKKRSKDLEQSAHSKKKSKKKNPPTVSELVGNLEPRFTLSKLSASNRVNIVHHKNNHRNADLLPCQIAD